MSRSLFMTRWCVAGVALCLPTLAVLGASALTPKRVLILDPFGRDVAPFSDTISAFRATLARELGAPAEFYEVPLELARFAEPAGEGPLVAFLEDRIKSRRVDLVVPVGLVGLQFAARHRERLFPNTPILVVSGDPRFIPADLLGTNAALVTHRVDLPGMVEDILQVQPQTTNIVVVFGASAYEDFWVAQCRREFQPFTDRVEFTWLNDLSLEQVLGQCANLPPRSFILHGMFVVDAAGVPSERNEALRRLHAVANAPLFSYFNSSFGLGPIGGRLYQDAEVGVQGARAAIRILRGESPGSFPPLILEATGPIYDWRELQRWGISEKSLPPDSLVHFHQPDFWERYRWLIGGLVIFILIQSALIGGLVINRARRQQGEAEATLLADVSSRFLHLPAGDLERELMAAQRRICRLLDLDLSALWTWSEESPGSLVLIHSCHAADDVQPPTPLNPRDSIPWSGQQIRAGRILAAPSMDDLPAEASRDKDFYGQFGVKSTLLIPLSVGSGDPIGALGFSTTGKQRDWPEALVNLLRVLSELFANALARKRADQAFRESEQRMTLAAEAAGFGVWVWNLARNDVWGSERWLRLFGFASGEAIDLESVIQRIYADDRETVDHEVRQAMANRTDYTAEFRAVLPDGTQRWIASIGRGYPDEIGNPARMLGTALDITVRKQTEASLHDLSRRLIRAHEAERARLARELHDDVTQRLARLAIDAARIEQGAQHASAREALRSVRESLVRLSEDIHALSYRLHPSVLEDLGLAEALKAECERFSRQESIATEVTLRELPEVIPPETALCLFRVVQEALRNVARHAKAQRVEISLLAHEDGLQLALIDNGIGFEVSSQSARPSLGLASMRERVGLIGGELDIESAPGHGTTILAWLPLGKG